MINFLEKTKTLFSLLPIKATLCLYSDTVLRYQGSVVWERKPCECGTFGSSGTTNSFSCTFKRANLYNVRRKLFSAKE